MPICISKDLPAYQALLNEKIFVMGAERAAHQDIRPLRILWDDGRQWEVTKVLHTCTASHNEFEGIRYTIKIGRAVKYLYRDGQRWYVDQGP